MTVVYADTCTWATTTSNIPSHASIHHVYSTVTMLSEVGSSCHSAVTVNKCHKTWCQKWNCVYYLHTRHGFL